MYAVGIAAQFLLFSIQLLFYNLRTMGSCTAYYDGHAWIADGDVFWSTVVYEREVAYAPFAIASGKAWLFVVMVKGPEFMLVFIIHAQPAEC